MRRICCAIVTAAPAFGQLPAVTITHDDTVIERSCRVVIPAGTVITDANGDGVIHILTEGITVEFADGAVLAGASTGAPGDGMTGVGVSIRARGVTLQGARVRGYKVGVHAKDADGLTVDGADLSGNYRQRLRSTPAAEDGADWLWPHRNDADEWMRNYGGALVVEDSDRVTIRRVRVRDGQNGIILDRVRDSDVYDNDCSFLSGWGLAMWRCERNLVSRNALDFCVRGYSHGVYNRGQDSAGILLFEQNHDNAFLENSVTHGGDGVFAFGGREAIGEEAPPGFDHARAGNRRNLFAGNDLSYAAAHGLELTFSFDNVIRENRMVENAICGIWGGYSQDTVITRNVFEGNGPMAYGLERGGVNIEHGAGNRIVANTFRDNVCGVHLWWDADEGLMKLPWAGANHRGSGPRRLPSIDNVVAGNTFSGGKVGLHLRDCDSTIAVDNTFDGVGRDVDATPGSEPVKGAIPVIADAGPVRRAMGETRPVGARPRLRGRDKIIMTAWGPWDHESPLVLLAASEGATHVYHAYNLPGGSIKVRGAGVRTTIDDGPVTRVMVTADEPGVFPYVLSAAMGEYERDIEATIVNAAWDAVFFAWPAPSPARDGSGTPRVPPDLAAWRALAGSPGAARARLARLALRYAGGGPGDLKLSEDVTRAGLKPDYFGMIARTTLPLRAGTWRVTTTSDDGVRVLVDGTPVVENWTHHGPARDSGTFVTARDGPVTIIVEHFEIFGYAVLEFDLERVAP